MIAPISTSFTLRCQQTLAWAIATSSRLVVCGPKRSGKSVALQEAVRRTLSPSHRIASVQISTFGTPSPWKLFAAMLRQIENRPAEEWLPPDATILRQLVVKALIDSHICCLTIDYSGTCMAPLFSIAKQIWDESKRLGHPIALALTTEGEMPVKEVAVFDSAAYVIQSHPFLDKAEFLRVLIALEPRFTTISNAPGVSSSDGLSILGEAMKVTGGIIENIEALSKLAGLVAENAPFDMKLLGKLIQHYRQPLMAVSVKSIQPNLDQLQFSF